MKKIIFLVLISILVSPTVSASEIPDVACDIVHDFSGVEPGDGGQEYVSNLQVRVDNRKEIGKIKLDVYDWLGNYVETIYSFDDGRFVEGSFPYTDEVSLTGLVDGTYTFIIDDTYKGTFNVNHEMQGLLPIDMSYYNACNRDAYGNYIDPNTIYYYDEYGNYLDPNDPHSYDEYGNYLATNSIGTREGSEKSELQEVSEKPSYEVGNASIEAEIMSYNRKFVVLDADCFYYYYL